MIRRLFPSPHRDAPDDCHELSLLGEQPDVWPSFDDDKLREVISLKFLEYGSDGDTGRIPGLFALYRHAMTRFPADARMELLNCFCSHIEYHQGLGHMGLMMFLAAETDPSIRSSAALSLSVLFDPGNGDELAGPRFVIDSLIRHDSGAPGLGVALGGVLLLGDKRIMPLLAGAWDHLSEEARIELTATRSGFVTEGIVEFWLDRLEDGCSEAVFGSAVAAIARMPVIARVPYVLDVERLLPAYAGGEPMRLLRRSSFAHYLEEIRPRLEAIAATESYPELIPQIYEMW